jgi:hypothetical protein
MGNVTAWALITIGTVVTFYSLVASGRGMHRGDVTEMFKRQRMVDVLQENTRSRGEKVTPPVSK